LLQQDIGVILGHFQGLVQFGVFACPRVGLLRSRESNHRSVDATGSAERVALLYGRAFSLNGSGVLRITVDRALAVKRENEKRRCLRVEYCVTVSMARIRGLLHRWIKPCPRHLTMPLLKTGLSSGRDRVCLHIIFDFCNFVGTKAEFRRAHDLLCLFR